MTYMYMNDIPLPGRQYRKKHIEAIEKVQRRFTKRLYGVRNYSYSERLQKTEVKSSKFETTKNTLRSHSDLSNRFWSNSTEISRILSIKRAQYYTRPSI